MAPLTSPLAKPNAESPNSRTVNSVRASPSRTTSVNGIGRSPSLRGSMGKPTRSGMSRSQQSYNSTNSVTVASGLDNDDENRANNIALLDELKTRLLRAETASEEYQKQLNLLQARLDDSQHTHSQLELQFQGKLSLIESLEADKHSLTRKNRELEDSFDAERTALLKDREQQQSTHEELKAANYRMKESLQQRNLKSEHGGESDELANATFAPPSTHKKLDQDDLNKAIASKDRVIESLRLELAESQIKIMEIDSLGDNRHHQVEKKLTEARVELARLTEENESFQYLLSEKTLNGEFKGELLNSAMTRSSLADELQTEEIETPLDTEPKTDGERRLEQELKSLRAENKSLSLYVEKIIGRLLQHKDFDTIFDKNPDLMSMAGVPKGKQADQDKELPPPPPPKDTDAGLSLLQRARSVVAGSTKRPRPMSHVIQPPIATSIGPPGLNEDPATAPSIPIGRSASVRQIGSSSHRRSQSDMPNPLAAPLVNQIYRGPPQQTPLPLGSPGLSPSSSTKNAFFTPGTLANTWQGTISSQTVSRSQARDTSPTPPGSSHHKHTGSSSRSIRSDHSDNVPLGNISGPSSPPHTSGSGTNNFTGAVMTQNRLRPLRLVQENSGLEREEEAAAALAARKKANRSSWMPNWMTPGQGT